MKDGGQAFPRGVVELPGMSLLDYFAGQALMGLSNQDMWTSAQVSKVSYKIAEEMIEERERRMNQGDS